MNLCSDINIRCKQECVNLNKDSTIIVQKRTSKYARGVGVWFGGHITLTSSRRKLFNSEMLPHFLPSLRPIQLQEPSSTQMVSGRTV